MTISLIGDGPILMVDDNAVEFEIAVHYYKKADLEQPFVHLETGEALLSYMDEVAEGAERMPSLVLLDINMPSMSGHEVLEEIRRRDAFREVPVLAMFTSSSNPADRERALANGANEYIEKPAGGEAYAALFASFAG